MKSICYIFVLVLFSIIISSCQNNNKAFLTYRSSVVKVKTISTLTVCDGEQCFKDDITITGTGFSVMYNGLPHILTAAHLCHQNKKVAIEGLDSTLENKISIRTLSGIDYTAKMIKFDEDDDMCLLQLPNTWIRPIPIAPKPPEIGDKIYSFGAPSGLFSVGMIPIVSGYFSGNISGQLGAYTIPSAGGSSGSPLLNTEGKVVGMIHSVHTKYSHFSLSPDFWSLNKFVYLE